MVSNTRRRFLQVATATLAGGLAGCSERFGDSVGTSRSVSEDGTDASLVDVETDPSMVHRRSAADVPAIYDGERDGRFTDPYPRDRSPRRIGQVIVDSDERADRITVADHVDGDPVSAFVSETDFEAETLFLQTTRVEACFRLRLCRVSWAPNDVQTDYARWLRPYDERCEADEYVYESRLMRLPAALDADEVNSYGSTIGGGGSCDGSGPAGRNRGSDDEASGRMPTGTPEETPTGTPAETTSESADGGDER